LVNKVQTVEARLTLLNGTATTASDPRHSWKWLVEIAIGPDSITKSAALAARKTIPRYALTKLSACNHEWKAGDRHER